MLSLGFNIIATKGTANYLNDNNIEAQQINKVKEWNSGWSVDQV